VSIKYVTVKLPEDIIKEIDAVVGTSGYSSRTEVIKDALRRFFESNKQEA
jgi:metal-responsive CopG/Arc/MetJ family transcriptional regulator